MSDLTTSYLGLQLASPLVASAGPATGDLATARRLVAAGAAAVVLPSLFEEEVLHDEMQVALALETSAGGAEAAGFLPSLPDLTSAADRYLRMVERTKAAVPVPVIASLNAGAGGGWARWARRLEEAGADALELNVYRVPTDPGDDAGDVEAGDLALVADVRAAVGIPLAVKLSPYYSALANFAVRVAGAGADGLVLFNRFYQPDIDLTTLTVEPRVELSHAGEVRLPLRWLAILRPILGDRVSLAASSGVHTGGEAAKALLVGADVVMMTSAVLRQGPEHFREVEEQLRAWMEAHGYQSLDELRGSVSHANTSDPSAFERAQYLRTLRSWGSPAPVR